MLYLVTAEAEEGILDKPPAQAASILEHMVLPSLEALAKMEQEKKITGGNFSGRRAGCFIVDLPSHGDVQKLLMSLPFWPLIKFNVTPIESYSSTVEQVRQVLKGLKAAGM